MEPEKLCSMLDLVIKEMGIPLWGYGVIKEQLPEELKDLPFSISLGIPLSPRIMDEVIEKNAPTFTYFHRYRTINTFIDQSILRLTMLIESYGYHSFGIPASQSINVDGKKYQGIFPHRTAATRSGLGWIGKNGSLINDKFGPRLRLGTILTDAPLITSLPINESSCGECYKCVEACPARALKGIEWSYKSSERNYDPGACSQHMKNQYKHIGRGAVCGLCIVSCPVGKRK